MKKRFTEEQIVAILQEQQNSGKTVAEIARKNGISENTFYIWKRKYGNMTVSEVTRLRELEDEYSKNVYKAAIKFRCTSLRGDLLKLWQKNQYFDKCVNLTDHESFVDCGSYIGDTILSFLENTKQINRGGYENIYAFEPDPKNCKTLQEFVDKKHLNNVKIFDVAVGKEKGTAYFETGNTENASSKLSDSVNSAANVYTRSRIEVKVDSIDNLLYDKKVSLIKMDIEGAETAALDGAVNVIKKQRPKLAICIYHSDEDMINLPLKIKNMVEGDYKFYVRHYSDTWIETVFYAIPV